MGRKLTQDEFEQQVKCSAPNLKIKGKYENNRSKIDVECKICGYAWYPKAQSIMNNKNESGIYCPSCNGIQQKTLEDLKVLIQSLTTDVVIINNEESDNDKINTKNTYKVFNKICGHDWLTSYNRIQSQGIGCPYCSNKKVLKGFNDIATTAPWMVKLLKNKNDAFKYTRCSNKKIDWICSCGNEILNKTPDDIYQHGLSCSNCSDKISYPERLISNILSELKVKYKTQYKIDGYSYRYDFYLFDYNYIIEVHGNQHYDEHGFGSFYENARTLKEEIQNDINKRNLAMLNGYNYIILDCRKSELNYIKNSVLNSELVSLFKNISDLDWDKIHINSLKSRLVYICELYNDGFLIDEICLMNGITHNSCIASLRRGTVYGLCDYSGIEKLNKTLDKIHKNTKKPVYCITTGEFFDSITSASKKYGFSPSLLSAHLSGKKRRAGVNPITKQNLIWEFA